MAMLTAMPSETQVQISMLAASGKIGVLTNSREKKDLVLPVELITPLINILPLLLPLCAPFARLNSFERLLFHLLKQTIAFVTDGKSSSR